MERTKGEYERGVKEIIQKTITLQGIASCISGSFRGVSNKGDFRLITLSDAPEEYRGALKVVFSSRTTLDGREDGQNIHTSIAEGTSSVRV